MIQWAKGNARDLLAMIREPIPRHCALSPLFFIPFPPSECSMLPAGLQCSLLKREDLPASNEIGSQSRWLLANNFTSQSDDYCVRDIRFFEMIALAAAKGFPYPNMRWFPIG